VLEPYKPM